MTVTVKIAGLDKLENGLRSLPRKIAHRVLGDALRKAARHLRDTAKKKVPVRYGDLRDAISVKSGKVKDSELDYQATTAVYLTGEDPKAGISPVWYAHLVEFGGRYVIKAKAGKKSGRARVVATGRIGAQPFMRPAFDSEKNKCIQIIADKVGQGVTREFKKLGNNG